MNQVQIAENPVIKKLTVFTLPKNHFKNRHRVLPRPNVQTKQFGYSQQPEVRGKSSFAECKFGPVANGFESTSVAVGSSRELFASIVDGDSPAASGNGDVIMRDCQSNGDATMSECQINGDANMSECQVNGDNVVMGDAVNADGDALDRYHNLFGSREDPNVDMLTVCNDNSSYGQFSESYMRLMAVDDPKELVDAMLDIVNVSIEPLGCLTYYSILIRINSNFYVSYIYIYIYI